ncbi:MAG TPA: glutamate--tRNA ligase [Actinomycetota bacterium]|nr:glutamate--tRNA ligase [Actinomycetota bacterium]
MNDSPDRQVRVRAAPAPSGSLHVGNVRTFLYNWLHARHTGGKFVLRIEDTDTSRFTEEAYAAVLEDLKWLRLEWDEGPEVEGPHAPYRQSQRTQLHVDAAERLLSVGAAYRCYCTKEELEERRARARAEGRRPGYDGRCFRLTDTEQQAFEAEGRPSTVRVHIPDEGEIVFEDRVIGPVTTQLEQIDDFAILRSDGAPLYHLAVVVDDGLMEITDVIRGDDLLSNTPKQILLHSALGNPIPTFAHLPQVLGPDRKPLSKRHGSTSIADFREAGYLEDALVNFLALLGWGTAEDTILSREELISRFDVADVHPSPAMFDTKKLDWMNGEYIRLLDEQELTRRVLPFYANAGLVREPLSDEDRQKVDAATPLIQTRIRRLDEAPALVRGLFLRVEMDPAAAAKAFAPEHVPELLQAAIETLGALDPWTKESVEAALRGLAEERQLKPRTAFAPFYVAISGSTVSAPVFDLMTLIGKQECLERLRRALEACGH